MAQARCFSLLADSNVQRFNSLVNRRACPDLDGAQVLICNKMAMFRAAEFREESNTVVVCCVSNFLASSPDLGVTSTGVRVEPVLLEVQGICHEWCATYPEKMFLICPPMYRTHPLWYRDGMSEVLSKFSFIFCKDNLTL